MREQVIAQKVGNRSALAVNDVPAAVTQRPARRESGGSVQRAPARLARLMFLHF